MLLDSEIDLYDEKELAVCDGWSVLRGVYSHTVLESEFCIKRRIDVEPEEEEVSPVSDGWFEAIISYHSFDRPMCPIPHFHISTICIRLHGDSSSEPRIKVVFGS